MSEEFLIRENSINIKGNNNKVKRNPSSSNR